MENRNVNIAEMELGEESKAKLKDFLSTIFTKTGVPERQMARDNLRRQIIFDDELHNNPILTDETDGLIPNLKFEVEQLEEAIGSESTGKIYSFIIKPNRKDKDTRMVGGLLAFDAAKVFGEILDPSTVKIEEIIDKFEIGQTST